MKIHYRKNPLETNCGKLIKDNFKLTDVYEESNCMVCTGKINENKTRRIKRNNGNRRYYENEKMLCRICGSKTKLVGKPCMICEVFRNIKK